MDKNELGKMSLIERRARAFEQLSKMPHLSIQCPPIGLVFTSFYGQSEDWLIAQLLLNNPNDWEETG